MTNTLTEIREQGIGNGFTVLNPADGYRKDNTLWFGECSVCGERVVCSWIDKVWTHRVYLVKETNHSVSRSVDYCPTLTA